MLNYATNAVKFSDHDELLLSNRIVSQSDDSAPIRFEVRDHGIGIMPPLERSSARCGGWRAAQGPRAASLARWDASAGYAGGLTQPLVVALQAVALSGRPD